MTRSPAPIPIYTTKGIAEAFLAYPMIYSPQGEWIGWVTPQREVYSVHGEYVGWLTNEPRILRKRTHPFDKPKLTPPPAPPARMLAPATVPLAPLMAELAYDVIDVLHDAPDLLPTLDTGDARLDMD